MQVDSEEEDEEGEVILLGDEVEASETKTVIRLRPLLVEKIKLRPVPSTYCDTVN